ncbi:PDZ and LIM domain protein 7-like isoform X3 [Ostrea edulis]|uniref:PDZ and LIM domain protein 7-like isoform X3 n=1 Tax=Ostrea edulis TaxID=37623 RepID=UPI0024AFF167|nr:PDZ and LIM domain protein 7-like isoform X3 [Ostrea edulis]
MSDGPILVRLRRNQSGSQWGFRLQGGYDQGSCLYIQKVNPKSIAYKSGLRVGDGILRIGNTPAQYLNHQDAKMEIIRAGNELDFVVQRNVVDLGQGDHVDAPTLPTRESNQSTVEEESTAYRGYTNPNVQSRSFKILQQSLNYSEASGGSSPSETAKERVFSLSDLVQFVECMYCILY